MSFYDMPGVLSASMIYQFSDELDEHIDFEDKTKIQPKLQSTEERVSA